MCLSDEIMVLEEEAIKCVLQQVNRRIVGTYNFECYGIHFKTGLKMSWAL